MTAKQIVLNEESVESLKMGQYKKPYHQEFVRDEVLIGQSIDPFQRIIEARKHLISQEIDCINKNNHKTDKD
jgi:hypothetical protein